MRAGISARFFVWPGSRLMVADMLTDTVFSLGGWIVGDREVLDGDVGYRGGDEVETLLRAARFPCPGEKVRRNLGGDGEIAGLGRCARQQIFGAYGGAFLEVDDRGGGAARRSDELRLHSG